MKGRITSLAGNKIIVHLSSSSIGGVYGKRVSIDGKRVGKVSEVIGRTNSPYLVIRLFPGVKSDSSSLIGKEINI